MRLNGVTWIDLYAEIQQSHYAQLGVPFISFILRYPLLLHFHNIQSTLIQITRCAMWQYRH